MDPTMKSTSGARPMVEANLEEHPVGGVVFSEAKAAEKYVDQDESAALTGLRAMARRFFRR